MKQYYLCAFKGQVRKSKRVRSAVEAMLDTFGEIRSDITIIPLGSKLISETRKKYVKGLLRHKHEGRTGNKI